MNFGRASLARVAAWRRDGRTAFWRDERFRFWGLVVGVGLFCGLVGAGYIEGIKLIARVLGPSQFTRPVDLAVLAGVGGAIGLLTLVLGSPGDVELLVDNIHVMGGSSDLRDLRSLIPVSALGIAAGSAVGPEAPLTQTTGSIGGVVARRRGLGTPQVRVLTITGMAAGFTVLFGAPLGSAIFALEILHRRGLQYHEALIPAAIGSLSGLGVYAGVTGLGYHPIWRFPTPPAIGGTDLVVGLAAGCAAALVAGGFTWAATLWRRLFRYLPVGARPVVGGVALGGLAFLSPYALTFGEGQIQVITSTAKLALATLVVGALAKFLASSMIMSAGWRGGFIIPMFFIGAALGSASANVLGVHRVVAMTALMAAINVGVTKTPFGSTLVVTEMAGIRLLPPVLLASIVALFLTSRVSMIATQREREGAFTGPVVNWPVESATDVVESGEATGDGEASEPFPGP